MTRGGRRGVVVACVVGACLIAIGSWLGLRAASRAMPGQSSGALPSSTPAASVPQPTSAPSLAFDPGHHNVVLFGGGEPSATTWLWDKRGWRAAPPSNHPSDRSGAPMAYDPASKRVLLFGGREQSGAMPNDTWAWDGRSWTHLAAPGANPPARELSAMAWDDARGQMVLLVPPAPGADTTVGASTWTWTVNQWKAEAPAAAPPAVQPTMAFDPSTRTVLLALSELSPGGSPSTWSWDGASWRELQPVHAPSLARAYLAHIPGTNTMILVSPASVSPLTAETWIWDGGDWTKRELTVSPPGLMGVVVDEAGVRVIAFGSSAGGGPVGAAWAWSGTEWARLASTGGA